MEKNGSVYVKGIYTYKSKVRSWGFWQQQKNNNKFQKDTKLTHSYGPQLNSWYATLPLIFW